MAGGNDKRKKSWIDDKPYYMQSEQVMRRRDYPGMREKYRNSKIESKRYEEKVKEASGTSWKGNKSGDVTQLKNKK